MLDASAALDFLLRDEASFDWIQSRLLADGSLAAPHLLDTEVTHVLRRHVLRGNLDEGRAGEALAELNDLPLDRYPAQPLLSRIWDLRHDLSASDATYVALAEALDATLITSDLRLFDLPTAASPVTIETRRGTRATARARGSPSRSRGSRGSRRSPRR